MEARAPSAAGGSGAMPPSSSSSGTSGIAYHRSENADVYRQNASFVYSDENTAPVLRLLDAQPGERILDVGCGSGELTLKLASLVEAGSNTSTSAEGHVHGVDASEDMIAKASAQAAAPPGASVAWDVVDCHDLENWLNQRGLAGTFDRVFSSAALHWMNRDPLSVARGMRAALRRGGAGVLAVELGGSGNVGAVHTLLRRHAATRGLDPDALDPWYFPTAEAYTDVLQRAGFKVRSAELVVRPTPLPSAPGAGSGGGSGGVRAWLRTFGGPFLNALPSDAEREDVVRAIEKELVDAAQRRRAGGASAEGAASDAAEWYDPETGGWTARYVRLRVQATLEE